MANRKTGDIEIGGRLFNTATGNIVAGADAIKDEGKGMLQSEINDYIVGVEEAINNLSPEQTSAMGVAAKANNNEAKLGYYVCSSSESATTKQIASTNYALSIGGSIKIKMEHKNTAASNVQLKVGSADAKPIYYNGAAVTNVNTWDDGETIEVYYDGTKYCANNVAGVESRGVYKCFGISENIEIAVTSGVELRESLQIPTNKGVTYNIKLCSTDLIDQNGITVYFRKGSTTSAQGYVSNGNNNNFTPTFDCDNIFLSRSASGIIGTGNITLEIVSNTGVIPNIKKLEKDLSSEVSRANSTESTLKDNAYNTDTILGIEKSLQVDVTTGVELRESLPLLLGKGVVYKVTLVSTPYIDRNGMQVEMLKGESTVVSSTIRNGSTVEMTPQDDVDTIFVSRSGTGIIGTGTVNLRFVPNDGVLNTINALNSEIGTEDSFNIPVVSGTALDYTNNVYLKRNKTYKVNFIQTEYVDSNGVTVHFRNNTTDIVASIVRNGSTIELTPDSDCNNIWIERSSGGIIGTGNIEIVVSTKGGLVADVEELKASASLTGYISPNGGDNNDGSFEHPLLTINKALEKGFSTILVNTGIYQQSNIVLSLVKNNNIKIAAMPNAYVVFYPQAGDYTRIESETKTTGYTNVYQTSIDSVPNDLRFAWQDNVADVATLISDAERNPLQRGKEYRLDSTKIRKCSSSQLQDALDEIDDVSNNGYRFFFDSNNSLLYFSRPQSVNTSNPICIPLQDKTFIKNGTSDGKTLELVDINVRYMGINLTKMIAPRVINCSAKYAYAYGGIMWFNSKGTYIERCESCGTQRGTNGDGFNASANGTYPAHNTSALLIDCWSHDNNDDGYSCHQRCEGILQGGLFEYNNKGGVTPSYGEKNLCYNVLSRKNVRGFYYTGTSDDGGKYGQSICFGCVSMNNSYAGFMCDGTGNKLIAIGCKSINDAASYRTPNNDSTIELINCGSAGANSTKIGNIVVTNTTLVE